MSERFRPFDQDRKNSPRLSRSGMQERAPSHALVTDWEAAYFKGPLVTLPGSSAAHSWPLGSLKVGRAEHDPVRACESEDLPAVPGAPRPAGSSPRGMGVWP